MGERIAVVIVSTGDAVNVVPITDELNELQAIVGGYIENLSTVDSDTNGGVHGYCNEEGKLQGLPVNLKATAFFREFGYLGEDFLCGTVVILGSDGEGGESSVPKWVTDYFRLPPRDFPNG